MSKNHPSTRRMWAVREERRTTWVAEDSPCWLCGQKIDWDVPNGTTDGSFEYDHYYPASTHPEHYDDPAKGRPPHRSCNRGTAAPAHHALASAPCPEPGSDK